MADINVERTRPSIWPWVVGLLVLAVLIWAIAEMVDRDRVVLDPVEEPVAVPEPEPAPPTAEVPVEIDALTPLGPEDQGRTVRVAGAVVGQPTADGFWVLTDQDEVIFVRTDRPIVAGEHIAVVGTLQPHSESQRQMWWDHARLREAAGWHVERELHVLVGRPPDVQPRAPEGSPAPPGEAPGPRRPGAGERDN